MGFASLLMDASSELIHSVLPVFLVTSFGASMTTVGALEGIAESTAAITKVFSGAISDYFRRRKFLMVFGYALAALTKPVFPLANSIASVFAARFVDRIGKGIRGAPRDALVAEIVPAQLRGAAFGLRQALDSTGAVIGPVLAMGLMIWFANDFRTALWFASIPAFLAVGLLIVTVREPERTEEESTRKRLRFADTRRLSWQFWGIVLLGGIFTLARFSEAFLVLRARDVGLPPAMVPVVMIAMNVVYAALAYPAGAAADQVPARVLLTWGLVVLVIAELVLAYGQSPLAVIVGSGLWGLHMALTQGLFSKLVADNVSVELLGTGFGLFNLITGGMMLLASLIAGALWSAYGAAATFLAGAGFAAAATIVLMIAARGHLPTDNA
jgi:MFS family permease